MFYSDFCERCQAAVDSLADNAMTYAAFLIAMSMCDCDKEV